MLEIDKREEYVRGLLKAIDQFRKKYPELCKLNGAKEEADALPVLDDHYFGVLDVLFVSADTFSHRLKTTASINVLSSLNDLIKEAEAAHFAVQRDVKRKPTNPAFLSDLGPLDFVTVPKIAAPQAAPQPKPAAPLLPPPGGLEPPPIPGSASTTATRRSSMSKQNARVRHTRASRTMQATGALPLGDPGLLGVSNPAPILVTEKSLVEMLKERFTQEKLEREYEYDVVTSMARYALRKVGLGAALV